MAIILIKFIAMQLFNNFYTSFGSELKLNIAQR